MGLGYGAYAIQGEVILLIKVDFSAGNFVFAFGCKASKGEG